MTGECVDGALGNVLNEGVSVWAGPSLAGRGTAGVVGGRGGVGAEGIA